MKIKSLIIWGLLATLVLVLVQFPASFVWQKLKHKVPQVQIESLEGSIWSAKATQAKIDKVSLDSLDLQLNPLRLLSANAATDFSLVKNSSNLAGELRQSFETGQLNDVSGKIAISDILGIISEYKSVFLPVPIDGTVNVDLALVRWNKQYQPQEIEGSLVLSDLNISEQALQGSYRVDITTENGQITAKAKNQAGAELLLDATIKLLPNNQYEVVAKVAASETASESLLSMLRLVGLGEKGKYRSFKYTGRYQPIQK